MTTDLPLTLTSDQGQADVTQTGDPAQTGVRPSYPLSKAAQMTGVSRSTIKRRLTAGEFPNAMQDDHGNWLVPVGDLLAAGLHLNRMTRSTEPVAQVLDQDQPAVTQVADPGRITELETQLAVEQARREAAEAIAEATRAQLAERGEVVAALRQSIGLLQRQLEAGTTTTSPPPTDVRVVATDAATDASTGRTGGPVIAVEPSAEAVRVDTPVSNWKRRTIREWWASR